MSFIRSAIASAVNLSAASASRTTGVAPLSVFFDATGITSSATIRPFHDVELRWTYGDSGAGTWGQGTRPGVNSKNSHYGPLGAHVYETPGTYTATVADSTGAVSKQWTIVVDDPDVTFASAKTTLVSTSGNFTGAGSGWNTLTTSDLATALAVATSGNTVRRILFRAGETWNIAGVTTLAVTTANGAGYIGSFGAGARPVWKCQAGVFALNDRSVNLSGAGTSGATPMKDWRVVDIVIDGTNDGNSAGMIGLAISGGLDQLTLLRLGGKGVRVTVQASGGDLDFQGGSHIWDQLSIVDSDVTSQPTGTAAYGWFMGAERLFFSGNSVNAGGATSHNVRFEYIGKGVVSNNTLLNPGASEHSIKLHGPEQGVGPVVELNGVGGGYSRWAHISDNVVGSTVNNIQVAVGAENGTQDERVKDVVLERNWHKPGGSGTQIGVQLWAAEITVRNCVIDMSSWGIDHLGVNCGTRKTQSPDQIRVYNNTFYTSDTLTSNPCYPIGNSDSTGTNLFARNNLGYAPNDSSGTMIAPGGTWTASNNSSNIHTDPSFVGPTTTLAGWALNSGSYAKAAGDTTTPVFSDIIFANRPAGVAKDMGAVRF